MESNTDSEETAENDATSIVSVPSKIVELMSHVELVEFFQESIKTLVRMDPLLKDVCPDVTSDEVGALLALENGQAITVFIDHEPCTPWKVVVAREATVSQLKKALKHNVSLSMMRRNYRKTIIWKYIWRTYWLVFEGKKLMDDKKLLSYNITNKARLNFLKKLRKGNNLCD